MTETPPPAAAFRLPTEPYPGLRPFLDHEAALLLGRGRQVREVIARLRETHFVAVIGGSGSGKSSLIRAGVVPELRGFGIPDAGDYWVPVVCTPGTTKPAEGGHAAASAVAPPQTPITRLAWKLSQQLEPAEDVIARRVAAKEIEASDGLVDAIAEAAQRRQDIAASFRQGAGFARLVKSYSDELPALGPQREKARFLFVIDQFEELFHPNNRENADAKALVEAVIDHFFNPHPRCFVVLTMRSEHLADCAGYLELPDAINKSSYLVRRLDDSELREAIIGPAKYFLRLLQRGNTGSGASADGGLPDDIVFDDAVIDRLLADVGKMTGDSDHLPLLQHVLARTWEAACRRVATAAAPHQIAGRIEWHDLEYAVDPRSSLPEGWLRNESSVNTLRHSLENWAAAIYRERTPEQQNRLDAVLRHLAFKDPNNGQYTQQRIDVDDRLLFDGVDQPRGMLYALLEHGFLDSVNYLFWDKENPEHVTLKVSHESFIRGWEHFRTIVDGEADHFEEFVALLRKCLLWRNEQDESSRERQLLEASDFARLEEAWLTPVLKEGDERGRWFDVLPEYRDGERLANVRSSLDAFVEASRERLERLANEQNRMKATRRFFVRLAGFALLIVALITPLALFAIFFQAPAMNRIGEYAVARDKAQRNGDKGQYSFIGEAGRYLQKLVEAAAIFDGSKAEEASFVGDLVERATEFMHRQGVPVTGTKRLLALTSSEPEVNGTLRRMLTSAAWPVQAASAAAGGEFVRPRNAADCSVTTKDKSSRVLPGVLFRRPGTSRGIFVSTLPLAEGGETTLYDVAVGAQGRCDSGIITWSLPVNFDPMILFDVRAEHMAVASGASVGATVSLYAISWEPVPGGTKLEARLKFRSVVTDPAAVALVRDELKSSKAGTDVRAVSVRSRDEPGGIGVVVGGQAWRLFSEAAQRIDASAAGWVPLGKPGPVCDALRESLVNTVQPGFVSDMLEHGNHCFDIQHGNPKAMALSPEAATEQVLVAVYNKPIDRAQIADTPPASIASLSGFGRFPAGETGTSQAAVWLVMEGQTLDGWIARRQTLADGAVIDYGAPWSTAALKRLAERLLVTAPAPTPTESQLGMPPASSPARPQRRRRRRSALPSPGSASVEGRSRATPR